MARAVDNAPRVYLRAFCHALLGTTVSLVPFRLSHTYQPTLRFQDSQLQGKGGGGHRECKWLNAGFTAIGLTVTDGLAVKRLAWRNSQLIAYVSLLSVYAVSLGLRSWCIKSTLGCQRMWQFPTVFPPFQIHFLLTACLLAFSG